MRLHRCQIDSSTRTFRNGQGGGPLIPQNVETDRTVGVDVGVVYLGREADLGRFERVVGWKSDRQEEDASGVW